MEDCCLKRDSLEKSLQIWEQNLELFRTGKLPQDEGKDIPDAEALLRLLFFYLLPVEFTLMDVPEYLGMPRNPNEALSDSVWGAAISSDRFGVFVSWRMTTLLFRSFGLNGQLDDYSNQAPVVLLGFDLGLWGSILFSAETAYQLEKRGFFPENGKYPYANLEAAKDLFGIIAKEGLRRDDIRGTLETEKEFPCLEDFQTSNNPFRFSATNPGRDFSRKWYGKRRKYKTTSYSSLSWVDEPSFDYFEEDTCLKLDYEHFKLLLNETDRTLLYLKEQGYTQTEIAKVMGYANHTTISKHFKKIVQMYEDYMRP